MAGPFNPAPTAGEADAAADPPTTDPAAGDPTGADPAADLTIPGDDADGRPTAIAPTVADVASDSSSDDRPIPFPPFSEQDEPEAHSESAAAVEQGVSDTAIVSAPLEATELPTEPSQAGTEPGTEGPVEPEPAERTGATERAESTAPDSTQLATDPATELAAEPATAPATEPSEPAQPTEERPDPAPQAVASPPPAPPPPYWTHSHADHAASSATTSALESDRLRADPPRTTASASASAASSSSAVPAGASSYLPAHQHRRDTSSSSSLLHVDLITLQDNEALEQMDQGSGGGGGGANGTAPGAGASSASSTASADERLRALHRQQRCWARRVDLTDYVIVGGGGSGSGSGSGGSGTGGGPRLGAFVVWTVRVETLEGTAFSIHKRYSEFDALRRQLVASFPQATASAGSGSSVASLFAGRRTQPAGSGNGSGSRPGSSSSGGVAGRANHHPGNKKKGRSRSRSRSRKGAPPTALPPLPPKSVLGNFRPAFLEQRRLGLQYFLNCILLNPEFAGSPILRDFLFA